MYIYFSGGLKEEAGAQSGSFRQDGLQPERKDTKTSLSIQKKYVCSFITNKRKCDTCSEKDHRIQSTIVYLMKKRINQKLLKKEGMRDEVSTHLL